MEIVNLISINRNFCQYCRGSLAPLEQDFHGECKTLIENYSPPKQIKYFIIQSGCKPNIKGIITYQEAMVDNSSFDFYIEIDSIEFDDYMDRIGFHIFQNAIEFFAKNEVDKIYYFGAFRKDW